MTLFYSMRNVLTLLIFLAIVGTVCSQNYVYSQDTSGKNWSDLSEEEKEAIRDEILRKHDRKNIPLKT